MNPLPGIQEIAHDLAAIIDPSGLATRGPGEIDLGEDAIIQEIAVGYALGIKELAHDLAAIIDSVGYGKRGAWAIDLGEHAIVQEKAMVYASGIAESAHDLATIIETKDNGSQGPREIDLGEGQLVRFAFPPFRGVGFLRVKRHRRSDQESESERTENNRCAQRRANASDHLVHDVSSFFSYRGRRSGPGHRGRAQATQRTCPEGP